MTKGVNMKRVCTGCKIEKAFEEFGKCKKGLFGINQKCKECCKARAKKTVHSSEAIEKRKKYRAEWQKRKRPILNERLKERYKENLELSREQGRERTKRYLQSEKGKAKHLETTRKYDSENKEKISAQRKVRKAVLFGKLIRPEFCEVCKVECKPHGHHEDYKKPLEVIWMCSKCHLYHHQKHRFHAERLNEKTPKGDAKVCSSEETARG
jgi:hypothetical protein